MADLLVVAAEPMVTLMGVCTAHAIPLEERRSLLPAPHARLRVQDREPSRLCFSYPLRIRLANSEQRYSYYARVFGTF